VLTIRVTGELERGRDIRTSTGPEASAEKEGDKTFDIAYVTATSPLLTSDRFLVPRAQVSTRAPAHVDMCT
jgi:hypothetical protein